MDENHAPSRVTSALPMKKNVTVDYTELQDFDDAKRPIQTDAPAAFQAWPTQPKPLVLAQRDALLYTMLDGALIILPVCLLVKTGLCVYAHHIDQDNTGSLVDSVSYLSKVLEQLNAQLVTLFTIVFVTIISTFVKRYALWKAQYGAYVSDLEQLQGSVSLPSTLKLIWSLRSFGVKSIVLLIVWSFYYLGSQAVKLEYRLSLSETYSDVLGIIQRPDIPSYFTPSLESAFDHSGYSIDASKQQDDFLNRLNIKFGSVILDEQDQAAQTHGTTANPGTRNGPLIPDYNYAVTGFTQADLTDKLMKHIGGWIDVSKQSQMSYVSLTGQTIWLDTVQLVDEKLEHFADTGAFLGSYTLHNISYINVTCDTPVVHPIREFPNGTIPKSRISFNMTPVSSNSTRDRNGYPMRNVDYWYKAYAADPVPGSDPYNARYNGTFNYTLRAVQTTCSLSTRYVDMVVKCITTGCYPNRLRWANNTSEYDATGYSTPFDSDTFATNFLSNYTLSTGYPIDPEIPTLSEQEFGASVIMNSSLWSTIGPAQCQRCYTGLIYDVFSNAGTKLMLAFNTYYMLSQAVLSDNMSPDMTELLASKTKSDVLFNLVDAHGAALDEGYRIYWQWIPVDFVACSILLAAAIGAYWLRVHTLAPDIFGYVSSLTRDNPHLTLPTEGSALSGIDRARMLRGVKVRIGDVQGGDMGDSSSVGRVGLAPVNAEVRPLYSKGVYV